MNENGIDYIVREITYPDATLQEVIGKLVRCGECKWWNKEHYQGKHDTLNYCENWENLSFKTDYCSYGERRTDEA